MPTLLVVDDDPGIRGLLELIGHRCGFEVDTASDGIRGLELLTERSYDLAILDLRMPRMSGYELIARIPELPRRPIVIVASAMTDSPVPQLDATVVHSLLRKPFDFELLSDLLTELTHALERRREERTTRRDPGHWSHVDSARRPVA
jgi:CheY-like chemotaxis protein